MAAQLIDGKKMEFEYRLLNVQFFLHAENYTAL